MALIEWTDDLKIGIESVDAQHRKLVDLINELNDAMLARKGDAVLGKVLQGLADYTKEHFAYEEKYFAKFQYNDRFAHTNKHTEFVDKIVGFTQDFEAGKMLLSMQIMRFLKDWLLTHIGKEDPKYVDCFREGGL